MTADRRKITQPPQYVLVMIAVLLAVVSGMVGIFHHVADFGPRVGDLVAFDPAHHAPFDSNARLIASRPQQAACVLDLATMQNTGGSLVLERRGGEIERLYRAHWSGGSTSRDADDCGSQADLELSRGDIDALAMAAGGFGVDHNSVLSLR